MPSLPNSCFEKISLPSSTRRPCDLDLVAQLDDAVAGGLVVGRRAVAGTAAPRRRSCRRARSAARCSAAYGLAIVTPLDVALDLREELLHRLLDRRVLHAVRAGERDLGLDAGAVAEALCLQQVERVLALRAGQAVLDLEHAAGRAGEERQADEQDDPHREHGTAVVVAGAGELLHCLGLRGESGGGQRRGYDEGVTPSSCNRSPSSQWFSDAWTDPYAGTVGRHERTCARLGERASPDEYTAPEDGRQQETSGRRGGPLGACGGVRTARADVRPHRGRLVGSARLHRRVRRAAERRSGPVGDRDVVLCGQRLQLHDHLRTDRVPGTRRASGVG